MSTGDDKDIVINAAAGGINLAIDKSITSTPAATGKKGGDITLLSTAGAIVLDGNIVSSGSAKDGADAGDGGAITIEGQNAATITVDGLITSTGGLNSNAGTDGDGGAITFKTANQFINLESTTITSSGRTDGVGGKVQFQDKVMLIGGASAINTGGTAGDIQFVSTLDGGQALTLTAGTGDIQFDTNVGAANPLSLVTLNAAKDVFIGGAFTASEFKQVAKGTGVFTISGAKLLTAETGVVTIDSATVDLDGSIRTKGVAKAVTITGGAGSINLEAGDNITTSTKGADSGLIDIAVMEEILVSQAI